MAEPAPRSPAPPPPAGKPPAAPAGDPDSSAGVVFSVDLAPRAKTAPAPPPGKAAPPGSEKLTAGPETLAAGTNGTSTTIAQTENPRLQAFFAPFAAIDQNAMRIAFGVPMILLALVVFWGAWRTSDRKIKRDLERMQGRGNPGKPKRRWS